MMMGREGSPERLLTGFGRGSILRRSTTISVNHNHTRFIGGKTVIQFTDSN